MSLFTNWLGLRDLAALLQLLETAEYFDPQQYNGVFNGELEKLLTRIYSPRLKQQVAELRGFDWGQYISRSLQRAGYRDDEEQEAFHQIAIKLLVEPGKLFRGWDPRRHGPLERRFRRSVWNAIRNTQEKNRNRQKSFVAVDPSVMAGQYVGRSTPSNNIISDFRNVVLQRLGRSALAILDQRLAGEDTKDVVGTPGLSVHSVKREIRSIKELAREFAEQSGDKVFLYMLLKAMDSEAATVEKRRAAIAARQAG